MMCRARGSTLVKVPPGATLFIEIHVVTKLHASALAKRVHRVTASLRRRSSTATSKSQHASQKPAIVCEETFIYKSLCRANYNHLRAAKPHSWKQTCSNSYSCTTLYYSTTRLQYYSVLQSTARVLLHYSVLQSTTPVVLCTTKYYSSTTLYYKVLLQHHSVLQSTTPVLLCTTKYYSSTTLMIDPRHL